AISYRVLNRLTPTRPDATPAVNETEREASESTGSPPISTTVHSVSSSSEAGSVKPLPLVPAPSIGRVGSGVGPLCLRKVGSGAGFWAFDGTHRQADESGLAIARAGYRCGFRGLRPTGWIVGRGTSG